MKATDFIDRSEGRIPFFYLDSKGFCTCGVGHLTKTLADAIAIKAFFDRPECVESDWKALDAQRTAMFQQEPTGKIFMGFTARYYERFSQARMPEPLMSALRDCDIAERVARLKRHFPAFDSYSERRRKALTDMAFNLGGDFPAPPHWPRFRTAVLSGNWLVASQESRRPDVQDDRNRWTAACLLDLPEATS